VIFFFGNRRLLLSLYLEEDLLGKLLRRPVDRVGSCIRGNDVVHDRDRKERRGARRGGQYGERGAGTDEIILSGILQGWSYI